MLSIKQLFSPAKAAADFFGLSEDTEVKKVTTQVFVTDDTTGTYLEVIFPNGKRDQLKTKNNRAAFLNDKTCTDFDLDLRNKMKNPKTGLYEDQDYNEIYDFRNDSETDVNVSLLKTGSDIITEAQRLRIYDIKVSVQNRYGGQTTKRFLW